MMGLACLLCSSLPFDGISPRHPFSFLRPLRPCNLMNKGLEYSEPHGIPVLVDAFVYSIVVFYDQHHSDVVWGMLFCELG